MQKVTQVVTKLQHKLFYCFYYVHSNITLISKCCHLPTCGNLGFGVIHVPNVPFRVFDKLKNEIQEFIIRFCFYHNMKKQIQIIDYYFHVKIDFCFEFLILSFVFHFHKKWKTKYSSFLFFIFMKELKNELLKQIKIYFMIVFTSMIYTLFKSKVVSSP